MFFGYTLSHSLRSGSRSLRSLGYTIPSPRLTEYTLVYVFTNAHSACLNALIPSFFRVVFVFENDGKENSNYKGVGGENIPYCSPVAYQMMTFPSAVLVDHPLRTQGTDSGTDTIGHQHE